MAKKKRTLKARLFKFMALPTAWFFRLWYSTLRVHHDVADPTQDPRATSAGTIIASWHGDLLLNGCGFNFCNIQVMISNSAEGEFGTRIVQNLGYGVVRGSSKRGGARAMLEMIDVAEKFHVAFALDGPKGPREVVNEGAVFLAAQTGLPIVAVGTAYGSAKRFHSWDRMALAWPGSRSVVCLWPGLHVPPNATEEELRGYGEQLQQRMSLARERAQQLLAEWIRTGKRPLPRSCREAAPATRKRAA
jgi:lysophospholipid acyltransferase (LPLAT)-like uncharacterized protein